MAPGAMKMPSNLEFNKRLGNEKWAIVHARKREKKEGKRWTSALLVEHVLLQYSQ